MNTRVYSLHNTVKFAIVNAAGWMKQQCDTTQQQFENFQTQDESAADFTVEIGPFERSQKKCFIVDDQYYVGDGYVYYKDTRKLSRWEVEVDNIERIPRIRIATNVVGSIMAPLNMIEFFIHYVCIMKNSAVVHASGVVKDGAAVLFPARSGGGKTTVALSLLERGFAYLGDNFIIVDNGVAKSFIGPLNIFTYNRLPIIERSLSAGQKSSMALKKCLYTLTGGYFKLFEKINPFTVLPDQIATAAPLRCVCMLEATNVARGESLAIREISREVVVKKLRYNMELDLLAWGKCMYAYGYLHPHSVLARFWDVYENVVRNALPADSVYISAQVPLQWNRAAVDEMGRIIEGKIKGRS